MANSADKSTRDPCVVGVVCMDIASALYEHSADPKPASYIAASYVKYLEAGGGLVVPIWIGRDRNYYELMMSRINGVLLTGGAVYLDDEDNPAAVPSWMTNDCVKSIQYIYELALQRNKANEYFPIWATCLGFQLMLKNAVPSMKRAACGETISRALSLQPTEDYDSSPMFQGLSPELRTRLQSEPFACYQHKYCITEESLGAAASDWRVLATGRARSGMSFITLIEHRKYPLYGCQFHPERSAYEQLVGRQDPWTESHTNHGIQLNQHFAHFFVEACRRNSNRFDSLEQLSRHLIYNWMPEFSGRHNNVNWLQVYLFPKDVDYVKKAEECSET
ncbi:PREDICTED: gamma-glutamyl hydrolase [Drosophila arizonae]|uniref:folate gamma-glutamyl hydrolase n=1 Tax=Drosophila arizonae TaxID=7263 RepID=A0ABM1P1S3_DROAR|nr:PREDICTED: gamma-glutamyl hydrolase [Drosophila arizonae]